MLTLACSAPPMPKDVACKRVPTRGRVWALGEEGRLSLWPRGTGSERHRGKHGLGKSCLMNKPVSRGLLLRNEH